MARRRRERRLVGKSIFNYGFDVNFRSRFAETERWNRWFFGTVQKAALMSGSPQKRVWIYSLCQSDLIGVDEFSEFLILNVSRPILVNLRSTLRGFLYWDFTNNCNFQSAIFLSYSSAAILTAITVPLRQSHTEFPRAISQNP